MSDWRLIEKDGPEMDGRHVDLWSANKGRLTNCFYHNNTLTGKSWIWGFNIRINDATHWMPIPQPPTGDDK